MQCVLEIDNTSKGILTQGLKITTFCARFHSKML